jgi:hypothetical protein
MNAMTRSLGCWLAGAVLAYSVVSDGMHSPQMRQKLEADGSQPAERMTPEQLKVTMVREYAELEQQVKQLNIKIEN